MKKFFVIWTGQILSMLGSGLTGFGLGVWIYQQTGSATQFAITGLFMMLPNLVMGPIGGILADRIDRRKILVIADAGQALGVLAIAALLFAHSLHVWHIYVATVIGAMFNCLRWPAFNAMLPTIAAKRHLTRVNGLVSAGEAATMIVSPIIAGVLVYSVGLPVVLLIDVLSFVVGGALLYTIRIPKIERAPAVVDAQRRMRSYWHAYVNDARGGWEFLRRRPALLALIVFFAYTNFSLGIIEVVFTPLVLSVGNVRTLGTTSSIAAVAMLLGSLVISTWGGPRRRLLTIAGLAALQGVLAVAVGWKTSITTLMFGAFGYVFLFPIIGACVQSLWQTKVPRELQGRVGAVRLVVLNIVRPASFFMAGALSDRVFSPLLAKGGLLSTTWVGGLMGVGTGRGIGLLVVVMGALTIGGTVAAFAYPRIRRIEAELPDMIADDTLAAQAA